MQYLALYPIFLAVMVWVDSKFDYVLAQAFGKDNPRNKEDK